MMPTKFIHIEQAGWIYLGVRVNGRVILLHRQGRVGDCIRPGQKWRG